MIMSCIARETPEAVVPALPPNATMACRQERAHVDQAALLRGPRLGPRRIACRKRLHVAVKNATDHVHLADGARAQPFGNAP
jgi:hypothetical protein